MKKKDNKSVPVFVFTQFPDFIRLGLIYIMIISAIYLDFENELIISLLNLLVGVYILSILLLSRFYFYENYLVVSYPTRFWSKGKTVYYSDISIVRERWFIYDRGFIIIRKGKYFKPELGKPGNSFPCNRKKKREQLIIFLKSKNVEVTKSD